MRVAISQFNPTLGNTALSQQSVDRAMERASDQGASLALFPECFVSDCVCNSLDEAMQVAGRIREPVTDNLVDAAARQVLGDR